MTDDGMPGRPIGGQPTLFGDIPVPVPIIPLGAVADALAPHHEAEPLPVLTIGKPTIGPTSPMVTTTNTTTTTTTSGFQEAVLVEPMPIRALSMHRGRHKLGSSGNTARGQERSRSPSPMGGSAPLPRGSSSSSEAASSSDDEARATMERANSFVFRKVTLRTAPRQMSASRLGAQRLARTGETPRPRLDEYSPPRMLNSAPDAPTTVRAPGPPKEWQAAWHPEVRKVMREGWCAQALSMRPVENATAPDLKTFLGTLKPKQAAFAHGLTVTEAAAIYLYTTALYRRINEPLREGTLNKLPREERSALEAMISAIDSGLPKLPKVDDELVRVVKLDEKFGSKLKPGKIWKQRSFGSCFRRADRSMSWDGNYELIFVSSGAYDVSALSDAAKEREVLVKRNCKYRIVGRDDTGHPIKLFLQEVSPKARHKKHKKY